MMADSNLNVQSACCGTCDSYHTLLPSGEVAVMPYYCSLKKENVYPDECCTDHPAYTGGVPQ
ncbi:hypothetical protein [uncultured Methanomethylovorans sp.]|uniref:hypothetical protein n=1 Tax=uncultured Methanomethylovorans sp. TaxID=183759 RepID=UPI002AA63E60|nr:hypothetical protein [uncultured Methanomethylovorans sp.]